ncbi:MAG: HD domain-containing protein [Atopobiaceae bacterium]|nr:HD domain-containing protein [Atopobiaceae bacterium]
MVAWYYVGVFVVAMALMIAYLYIWHKHLDIHITLIFALVPVTNLGYVLLASARTLGEALIANKLSYVGGCYLTLILMLAVFSLCTIEVSRRMRVALFVASTIVYASALAVGTSAPFSTAFYRDVTFDLVGGVPVLTKVYGPMHTAFIALVILYVGASMAAIIYSYRNKKQVSRKTLGLLFLTEAVAMVSFFGGRRVVPTVELLPVAYDIALVLYLVIAHRISLYDVTDSAIDSLVQTGETGFVSFDHKLNYLGSNAIAKRVFPQLEELTVDKPLAQDATIAATLLPWIEAFEADENEASAVYERGEHTYRVTVHYLFSGKRKRGYQLFLVDDTEEQRYIKLLNTFNATLQDEVSKKTAHIVEMHDNLVMGMAMMVESRDNSTGGHIKRTSEGVRLLIAQMRASGAYELSDDFCRDVIKAAPMHDLGKIAVDDAVLRKPGRFTAEEFQKMKAHAAEGARIVHEILKNTDDEDFHHIAENVAHYHHERWDGSGYPEGLAGEDIPLEARIMAIADVYDALVSKRVYKEAMSFEKADAIIMEGMGSQFDKGLEEAYVAARPHLEDYYRSL